MANDIQYLASAARLNSLYARGRELFLLGHLSWFDDDFDLLLVDDAYAVDIEGHKLVSDLPPTSIVARHSGFLLKDGADGYAASNGIEFLDLTHEEIVSAVVIATADPANDLIAYFGIVNELPAYVQNTDLVVAPNQMFGGGSWFRL